MIFFHEQHQQHYSHYLIIGMIKMLYTQPLHKYFDSQFCLLQSEMKNILI